MPTIAGRLKDIARRFFRKPARVPADPRSRNELIERIRELELAGRYDEVVRLCEASLDDDAPAEVHLALSRCWFVRAAAGDEFYAWPALLAALDGIARRGEHQGDTGHAVGICRWVLEFFADSHRLNLVKFGEQAPDLAEIDALYQKRDYVGLGNALLAAAPTVMRHGRDQPGVAREARYLYATVASTAAPDKVNDLLAAANFPMPGGHEAQPYDRYLLAAANARRRQRLARRNGVPGLLVAALPRSASEFLCYTLAEATGAAVGRVSVGAPFHGPVYSRWVADVLQGGCITHDHFAASAANLAALCAGGAERVVVLVRDPRAVWWSLQNMTAEWERGTPAARITETNVRRDVGALSDWIDSWLGAQEAGFAVTFLRFKELTADPAGVMGQLLEANGAGRFVPRLHEVLQRRAEEKRVSSNFRRGDDDAWRGHVSSEIQATAWEQISDDVRSLLALLP
jgi:hypothetical protein